MGGGTCPPDAKISTGKPVPLGWFWYELSFCNDIGGLQVNVEFQVPTLARIAPETRWWQRRHKDREWVQQRQQNWREQQWEHQPAWKLWQEENENRTNLVLWQGVVDIRIPVTGRGDIYVRGTLKYLEHLNCNKTNCKIMIKFFLKKILFPFSFG